jgi:hypothetical protein
MSLDKYFKCKSLEDEESIKASSHVTQSSSKKSHIEINPNTLLTDPGLRGPIYEYHINDRDAIRRAYLQKGPCQSSHCDFPQKQFGNISTLRRFNPAWFGAYPIWLEYSIAKDAVFCLYCYLFKSKGGVDSFVGEGFSNWKKKEERFDLHIGQSSSYNNAARIKCENLMNEKQSIITLLSEQTVKSQSDYRTRLNASIECARFLLHQGLPFYDHDECECSSN